MGFNSNNNPNHSSRSNPFNSYGLFEQQNSSSSTTNSSSSQTSHFHHFTNLLVDRFELSSLFENCYRRDLASLFKLTELGARDSLIKIDGINYHHPCFQLQEKFNLRSEKVFNNNGMIDSNNNGNYDRLNSNSSSSGNNNNSNNSNYRKPETSGFDIDALIEMTYNS